MRTPRSAPFLPEGTDSCIILKCSESSCVSGHLCLHRFCRGVTQPSPQFLLWRAGVRAGPARPRATSSPSGGKMQPRWSRPAWTTPSVFVFPRTAALPGIEQDAITSSRVPWALPGEGGEGRPARPRPGPGHAPRAPKETQAPVPLAGAAGPRRVLTTRPCRWWRGCKGMRGEAQPLPPPGRRHAPLAGRGRGLRSEGRGLACKYSPRPAGRGGAHAHCVRSGARVLTQCSGFLRRWGGARGAGSGI